jgi:hypothetical protein
MQWQHNEHTQNYQQLPSHTALSQGGVCERLGLALTEVFAIGTGIREGKCICDVFDLSVGRSNERRNQHEHRR